MNVKRLTIQGFRNLDSVSIELGKFNVLIAFNNYGKSNVLRAIDFGARFLKASPREKYHLMAIKNFLPINKQNAGKDFLFDIEFITFFNSVEYIIKYKYSFTWIQGEGEGRKITSENLQVKRNEKKQQFRSLIKRDGIKALYLSSPNGRCDSKLPIEDDELLLNKLELIGTLFYQEILEKINNINLKINSSLDMDSLFGRIDLSPKVPDNQLDIDEFSSVSKFIYHLKSIHPDRFSILLDAIYSLLPNVEQIEPVEIDFNESSSLGDEGDIPFSIPDKIYEIRIKERTNNQATSIRLLSSGSQRIIHILCMAMSAQMCKVPLVAFEELENSIHPSLLQRLLIILDSLAEDVKILLTSHSPYLLQYLDIKNFYFGIPNDDNLAMFQRISGKAKEKKLVRDALELELSLGEYIFDLFLESKEEPEILQQYMHA